MAIKSVTNNFVRHRQHPCHIFLKNNLWPLSSNFLYKNRLTPDQAFEKIKGYCSYQERCHSEVVTKLYTYGLYKKEVDELIVKLIEENYLNEERFAILYAGGKFRINNWGRKKIAYEMQQKRLSSFCIKVGLKAIDEKDYQRTLNKLALVKWSSLSRQQVYTKIGKTQAYLTQKGFEPELIKQALEKIRNNKD
ncbi:MAG: RecX family transcriptional regulator [Segetibacter sp.]|jgi:regulatory protein|nr:RecX family transcriptional regulator [Segetibacter sp.]